MYFHVRNFAVTSNNFSSIHFFSNVWKYTKKDHEIAIEYSDVETYF